MENNEKLHLLILASGSVATSRVFEFIEQFTPHFKVRIVFSKSSMFFVKNIISNIPEFEKANNIEIFLDEYEWEMWSESKKVLHIELRKWADVLLIAPLSANTLAKITNGICDNLLTCVVRAWDFKKPGVYALAMNTMMYEHFLTTKQIKILNDEFKFSQVPSVSKKLACGDVGIGGIADTKDILETLIEVTKKLNKY